MPDTWTGKVPVGYNPITRKLETVPDIDDTFLAAGSVKTAAILDANVTNAKLAAMDEAKIKVGQANNTVADVAVTGDITITAAGVTAIGAGKVTAPMLAAAVDTDTTLIAAAAAAALAPATSGTIELDVADAAEVNTLAIPTFRGQKLAIVVKALAGSGTRAITAASAINATGNTRATFSAVGQFLLLQAVTVGAALAWRVAANDGATLATP